MIERVLVRKKKSGAIIGCSMDIADRYVASGTVEIIPVSPLSNGYHATGFSANNSCNYIIHPWQISTEAVTGR